MEEKQIISRTAAFNRMWRSVGMFLTCPVGGKAKAMAAALLLLILCINGANVLNSFVGRYLMTSIERRQSGNFVFYLWTYAGVFAVSTTFAVFYRFTEQRLALLWRDWLTSRIVNIYIMKRLYVNLDNSTVSNPDQRIAEDIRTLTTTTLSFLLMIINSTITTLSFAGVLWNISPQLFVVSILYAAFGSVVIMLIGRPLVALNYAQSDREAEFRAELVRVRNEALQISETRNDTAVRDVLLNRIQAVVANLKRIIALNRTLDFFTTGYNYGIQIVPIIFVAPYFIREGADFGIISQSAMAFTTMVNAFSLIVTQFQSISGYASVVTRLDELAAAADRN